MTELYFPELRRPRHDAGTASRLGVVGWWVEDGAPVRVGQPLAEVRVLGDGTSDLLTALATGTLWHQVHEGELLPPGAIVGLIE